LIDISSFNTPLIQNTVTILLAYKPNRSPRVYHRMFQRLPFARLISSHIVTAAVLFAMSVLAMHPTSLQAQKVAKYGADFLSGGVGGRALGMGGTHVGIVQDVSAVYWNPAGLAGLMYPQISYMHAERFAGIVSFDYAGAAIPLSAQSTVGLTLIRSGVDDIPNTLNAWDAERNQPKPNPENFIERFSAADYAFLLSYARSLTEELTIGVTGKIVRRTIGDFADAWGYSFDAGIQWISGPWMLGANLQDVSTMLQSWSINKSSLVQLADFQQEIPEGGTFLVLPVARLGGGYRAMMGPSTVTLALDLDVAFDGQQAFVLNAGDVSFHPRLGAEYTFKEVVSLRAGISRVLVSDAIGFDVTPTVGAGLRLNQISLDYGFGDFAGLTSDLGFSHRVSARLILQQPRLKRDED
jgi:hypothetical protein